MSVHNNYRSIYDLLDKLCRKFSPEHHKDLLKSATSVIAESKPYFLNQLQFDESIIVGKIKNHLSNKSQANLTLFLSLHEELSTLADPKFRSSILTLLMYLSDMESKLPNAVKHDFSLPVRNRSIEPSMEQIYRSANFKVIHQLSHPKKI